MRSDIGFNMALGFPFALRLACDKLVPTISIDEMAADRFTAFRQNLSANTSDGGAWAKVPFSCKRSTNR
jgi:hypothetical protein